MAAIQQNPYAIAEYILLFTAASSLLVSVLVEAILMFSTRKTSASVSQIALALHPVLQHL